MTPLSAESAVLPVAVRAWTVLSTNNRGTTTTKRQVGSRRKNTARRGVPDLRDVLVFDTETTIDAAQSLTFGGWAHLRVEPNGSVARLSEGMFHADDLETTDPAGYYALRKYVASHRANVDINHPESNPTLTLVSRDEFCYTTFRTLAWKAKAHVVMFNKPFDLSRIAEHAGDARKSLRGGFSLRWTRENRELYDPRVRVKHVDSVKSFASFSLPKSSEYTTPGETNHGAFLDLRTWAFALTATKHTLESACKAFGVEHGKMTAEQHGIINAQYIDYARRDVLATGELFAALLAEHNRHPIDLPPTQAYSAASVAKAYLNAMGVSPLGKRCPLDSETMGQCMSTFYGGRSEVRIRHTPVPVELVDFTSMYPTVNALMGLWRYLTANTITADRDDAGVQTFLDSITLDAMFHRESWPPLVGIAEVIPDGDILPIRADYRDGSSYTIGVNPLTHDEGIWYTIADLAASTLLTGKAPKVLRAYRFTPHGTVQGLTPIKFRGTLPIDPTSHDFFQYAVEERQRVKATDPELAYALKIMVNAGSYGLFAQVDRRDKGKPVKTTIYSYAETQRHLTLEEPEMPGPYCYPPIAASITGAARLMLAMAERCVTDAGGSWAFCDTDSLAIVTAPTHRKGTPTTDRNLILCPGGRHRNQAGEDCIKGLTHHTIGKIKQRFAELSPYDPDAVTDILKTECGGTGDPVSCYAISAKRYALYRVLRTAAGMNQVSLVRDHWSEHGLGHLLNPTDPTPENGNKEWIAQWWVNTISQIHPQCRLQGDPEWIDRPAVGAFTVTTPKLWHLFDSINADRPYAGQVKPFNFLITCTANDMGATSRMVAPYNRNPAEWLNAAWFNVANGQRQHPYIDTLDSLNGTYRNNDTSRIAVKTYRRVLTEHLRHPEAKFIGPDGKPCRGDTIGLLSRRPTVVSVIKVIGKESNNLDAVTAQINTSTDSLTDDYTDPNAEFRVAAAVLAHIPMADIRDELTRHDIAVTDRAIRAIRAGAHPRTALRAVLTPMIYRQAYNDLCATLPEQHNEWDRLREFAPLSLCVHWAHNIPTRGHSCECGCGNTITGRKKYVSNSHRMAHQRHAIDLTAVS